MKVQVKKRSKIGYIHRICTDHGKEFENSEFTNFCDEQGIRHEFSAPKTPQQNDVLKRKNRVIQEMARVMLHGKNIARKFWAEVVNTTCYIANRVYLRMGTKQTPYELWKGKKPNVKYLRVFESKCYILRDRENLGKFDSYSDERVFLGYSFNGRACRVDNFRTLTVMESINVVINGALVHIDGALDEKFDLDSGDSE